MMKCRILLVEDHETVREALEVLIDSQEDMEVVGVAGDGGAAVERAQRLTPDLVVLDLSMPGVNGLQATEVLRRCCPHTRLLVLTRHSAEGYLRQALHAGVDGYVLKQSPARELLQGIRAVASGGKYLDRAVTSHIMDEQVRPTPSRSATRSTLTHREEEVLRLISRGYGNKEAAGRLGLSVKTIETHKANGMMKLGMSSRIDLVQFAHLHGWFDQDQ
jgi:DNA-binding NarL/FixJ family response regulator